MKNTIHKMKSFFCHITLAFIAISVVNSATTTSKGKYRCDYTYFKEAGGYLKYHEIPSNWHEARLRCHLEGAKLASPLTSGISNAINKLLDKRNPDSPIFTGINAIFSRGDYFSVEGIPLSKIPHLWDHTEPDADRNNENCLILLPDEGKMADVRFSETYPYVCYKKAPKPIVTNDCGTTDPGYVLYKQTGSCYKFHTFARTWSRAYMTCVAEGGHLAIINSEAEAQVIRDIFAKYPADSMIGRFEKHVAHIGFHDWNEHGEWLTVHGDTLTEAGYDKFSPGQPDNASTGEYCGSVFRSGLMNDLWCENPYAFFCEKSPNSYMCD